MLYDTGILGGGLAGATLAKQMAERGYRVLVLEQERQFKDRVLGEQRPALPSDEATRRFLLAEELPTC